MVPEGYPGGEEVQEARGVDAVAVLTYRVLDTVGTAGERGRGVA